MGLASMGMGMAPQSSTQMSGGVRKKLTIFTMLNIVSSMKYSLNQSLALLMLGSSMGMGMALEFPPDVWRGQEKVSYD